MAKISFSSDLTFSWPVTVCLPQDGDFTEVTFTGQFQAISDVEWVDTGDAETASAHIANDIARLKRVFVGWPEGEIETPDGPFPPTPQNIDMLLNQRPYRMAISEAYMAALNPKSGHRAGN